MPLAITDFKRPKGRLTAAWFVDDLDTLLTELLTQATAASSDETTQEAFVYAKAFSILVDDMMHAPASYKLGPKSEQVTPAQLAHFRSERDRYQAKLDALTGVGGAVLTAIGYDT